MGINNILRPNAKLANTLWYFILGYEDSLPCARAYERRMMVIQKKRKQQISGVRRPRNVYKQHFRITQKNPHFCHRGSDNVLTY
jgi:hypothetical protein